MSGIMHSNHEMSNEELWDKYLELLIAANDESKTERSL